MYSGISIIDGRYQVFNAPSSGIYKVELWGAAGDVNYGGKGAYTSGEIYLNKNENMYIYVGGNSESTTGGWNGGGTGYNGADYIGYGGGGATDIRLTSTSSLSIWNEFDSLKSRIMVAAGGGGSNNNTGHKGGNGGALIGENGASNYGDANITIGATQSMGGYNYTYPTNASSQGGFGYGGNTTKTHHTQGAGGGGYYGGGGAGIHYTGGSGGSSYISGYRGCSSIEEESTSINIIHNGDAYHYSGYYFNNSIMYSGSSSSIPTWDGTSTMTGNSGDGYAKITLKEEKEQTESESLEILNNIKSKNLQYSFMYSGINIFSGKYQVFTAPFSGIYQTELWGASGDASYGGRGAYTSGNIYLNKGEKLYIYVGSYDALTPTGGWNGGGNGYNGDAYIGYGGGGSTDIRLTSTSSLSIWNEFESLKSRIMVAAGGGGGNNNTGHKGGNGGTLNGENGQSNYGSGYITIGATQVMPGYANNNFTGSLGGFGFGSNSTKSHHTQGGAGGGYYGGGAAAFHYTGGSGGSSYISGHDGCLSIDENSTSDNIIHNGSAYHYSGYYFTNTIMHAGSSTIVPTIDGTSTMTGNYGNGYAKITLKTITTKTDSSLNSDLISNLNIWYYPYSATSYYTGRYQKFTALKNGTYSFQLWGASGGGNGGKGAYTYGDIYLSKGTTLYLYIGGTTVSNIGGYNGGGIGYNGDSYIGYGGGGATDVRVVKTSTANIWNEFDSLKSRIMVAAGGGGSNSNTGHKGGSGGGLIGENGISNYGGSYYVTGGTQISGGYALNNTTASVGGFGVGASGSKTHHTQGAGGSGWFGGGGASYHYTGGGGGSSYISGHAGCIGVNSSGNSLSSSYSNLSDSYSYTNYIFSNTNMVDGDGYSWGTSKSSVVTYMPTTSLTSTQTGQSGNGYALVKYLGE